MIFFPLQTKWHIHEIYNSLKYTKPWFQECLTRWR